MATEYDTYWSYQSVERRPVTVEVFGPIVLAIADPGADETFNLMELPVGAVVADFYIEVETACVMENAGTCLMDLSTDEGTPYVFANDVSAESAALTRMGTGVIRQEASTNKLQLVVTCDGAEAMTTAGAIWVVLTIVRRAAL
jgi:hypothetical protein